MVSYYMALPREGHLNKLFRIFSYLRKCHNMKMVFDPSDPIIDESKCQKRDWTSRSFANVWGKQEIPHNTPHPIGFGCTVRVKVDTNHAADKVSRGSRNSFLVYIAPALICCFSKKQHIVKSRIFDL